MSAERAPAARTRARPPPGSGRLARAAPGAAAGRAGLRRAVPHPVSALVPGDGVRQRRHQPALGQQLADRVGRVLVRRGGGAAGRRRRCSSCCSSRAEGQAFHVPGGDGGVITAAGFWTCVLIVWRIFDKEGTSRHGQIAYTSGIEWGIFVALGVAAVLTYAGSQIRLAHEPEPPLPGEADRADAGATQAPPRLAAQARRTTRAPRGAATTRLPGARHGRRRGLDPGGADRARRAGAAPPRPRPSASAPTPQRPRPSACARHLRAPTQRVAPTPQRPRPSAPARQLARYLRSQRAGVGTPNPAA